MTIFKSKFFPPGVEDIFIYSLMGFDFFQFWLDGQPEKFQRLFWMAPLKNYFENLKLLFDFFRVLLRDVRTT